METRKLGNSGLQSSIIGFGAWAAGKAGWGDVDEKEQERAIAAAVDSGVNFFDTAPVYGFGESEKVLGKVLKPLRDKVIVATKFGLTWDNGAIRNDLSRGNLLREIDLSLQRLDVDYIDLYQVHWPDPQGRTPFEETFGTLNELVQAGKIRYIGVSNFSVGQIEEARAIAPIVSLQSPYSLLQRGVERSDLPYVRQQGIGFIPYSPLAQGLLTGKYGLQSGLGPDDVRTQLNPLFAEGAYEAALVKVETLKRIAAKYGKTPGQTALSWLASNPAVTTIIAGAKSVSQVQENVGGTGWQLDAIDKKALETAFGI